MSRIWIGCSGFNYKHWRGVFYPEKLPQRLWLQHYQQEFDTVELNVTFYRLPQEESFIHWHDATPDDFAVIVKGSRYITHIKRLLEPEEPLQRYFERALLLKEKLHVVLWQFPPSFNLHLDRFSHFLQCLKAYPVRHAFEFRHESWIRNDEVTALCRDHNVALCMAEYPTFNEELPLTADFAYFRRHGHGGDMFGRFPIERMERDAATVRRIASEGRDVYFYFNNDAAGSAIFNARELKDLLGHEPLH